MFIPLIISHFVEIDFVMSLDSTLGFWLHQFPLFIMYGLNLWLVNVMKVLMYQKKQFKQAIFCAINKDARQDFEDETGSHFLPHIKLTIPGNLTMAFYCWDIL